jgi:hypothetical protein
MPIENSELTHDEQFYINEDRAAMRIGRDDAPAEDPDRVQARFRQEASDQAFQDEQERLDFEANRLYRLMQQEGVIPEDDNSESGLFAQVYDFVAYDDVPENRTFADQMAEIQRRDEAGEWVKGGNILEPIPKAKDRSEGA